MPLKQRFGKEQKPTITSQETCLYVNTPIRLRGKAGCACFFMASFQSLAELCGGFCFGFVLSRLQIRGRLQRFSTTKTLHSRGILLMNKLWKFGATAGLAAVLMAGCGETAAPEKEVETPAEPPTEVAEVEFPVTVTDAVGNEVVIDEEPGAIVSMIPSNTEIAYELGLGDKIIGISDYDNYPEETADVEKIGGQEFNVEKIIGLQPDLVLAHESGLGVGDAGLQQLRDAGLDVFVVQNAESFDEVYDSITTIGQATGSMEQAENIVSEMEAQVASIEELAATVEEPKTVFLEVGSQPDIYTTGSGTFMDEMLTLINAENVAGDLEGWIIMDPEAIVAANPDVIITTEGAYVEDAVGQIKSRGGFAEVTAVKEEAVYSLDSDMLTRSGPRLTAGLMEMAQAVYPDVFNE